MYNYNIFSNVFSTEHLQKQPLELFYRKATLKAFALFTGKHLKAGNFIKKRL